MLRRPIVVMVLLAGAILADGCAPATAPAPAPAPQESLLGPVKAQWENTRGLVTGIVGQVPEDLYDFKPTPEVRSFREQFTHLIAENYRFMAQAAGEEPPIDVSTIDELAGRDEILQALTESYDYGAQVWAGMDDNKAREMIPGRGGEPQMRLAAILLNIVDNNDHYGNLVVYVRLNGMVPGRTAARQQQQQQ